MEGRDGASEGLPGESENELLHGQHQLLAYVRGCFQPESGDREASASHPGERITVQREQHL